MKPQRKIAPPNRKCAEPGKFAYEQVGANLFCIAEKPGTARAYRPELSQRRPCEATCATGAAPLHDLSKVRFRFPGSCERVSSRIMIEDEREKLGLNGSSAV